MEFASLRSLYESGELPTVVSDSECVLTGFSSLGFRTLSVNDLCMDPSLAPKEVILVAAAPVKHPNFVLRSALRKSAVLFVPLLDFAHDQRSISYFIRRLIALNFLNACEKSRTLIEYVQHTRELIEVASDDCRLLIELGSGVDVFAPKLFPSVEIGESISIIQFLEVGLVPNQELTSFNVNGSLVCDGVSIAHHLHSHFESGPIAEKAWQTMEDVRSRGGFPLVLEIKDSKPTSITTRYGENILSLITPFTDEMLRGQLTEVAFASLSASTDTDWTINSQLNEPAGGVHVALGAGETAAHIDFVSSHAQILNFRDYCVDPTPESE